MVSGMGRRAHAGDGRGPSGLVRFAPALLGRAADYLLLRKMRRDAEGFWRAAQRGEVVPERRSGCVVHAFGCGTAAGGNEVQMRSNAIQKRRRHSGCVVRFGLDASGAAGKFDTE